MFNTYTRADCEGEHQDYLPNTLLLVVCSTLLYSFIRSKEEITIKVTNFEISCHCTFYILLFHENNEAVKGQH